MRVLTKILMVGVLVAWALSLSSCLWFFSIFNKATVGGVDVELTHAAVLDTGSAGDGTVTFIILMSDGLDYSGFSGVVGTGDAVMLIVLADGTGLIEATYPFNDDPLGPPALLGGEAIQTFDSVAGTVEADIGIDTGEVIIAEVMVGDWMIEWDCSGTDAVGGASATTTGKIRLSEDDIEFDSLDI